MDSFFQINTCTISTVFTRGTSYHGRERGLLICYPDTDLAMAKQLMEAKGIKQLPVVKRAQDGQRERRRRKVVGLLYYDSIWQCLRYLLVNSTCYSLGISRAFYTLVLRFKLIYANA